MALSCVYVRGFLQIVLLASILPKAVACIIHPISNSVSATKTRSLDSDATDHEEVWQVSVGAGEDAQWFDLTSFTACRI